MTPAPASNLIDRLAGRVLAIVFVAALWLPTFDCLWNLDHSPPPTEKRRLADFPDYRTLNNIGSYLGGLEHYFDDHFGFRSQLVHWNIQWKLKLFKESPVEMAMEGRDGWLYWAAGDMLANFEGAASFNAQELNDWQKLLEGRRDWLAARGEKYLFVIAPDKHSVYPEYLPEWAGKPGKTTKLDQFLAYMRAHSTVQVLDLRPALIAAKNVGATYLKTDTHWNNFGAFVAYQEVIRSLQGELPPLAPLPLDAFDRKGFVGRGGDLAICLDQENELQETEEVLFSPRSPLTALKRIEVGFVENQNGTGAVITRNPDAAGKVVLFRDSFAERWVPFLGHHFNEAIYLWKLKWNKPFLQREKPDVVIDEIVERSFNDQDPRQLLDSN